MGNVTDRPVLVLIGISHAGTRRNSIDNDNRLHISSAKKIKHLPISDVVKQNDSVGADRIE